MKKHQCRPTIQPTLSQAKKIVRKRYPYATSVNVDPFYGWAVKVAAGSDTAIVQKQRDEEAAWLAAAAMVLFWE